MALIKPNYFFIPLFVIITASAASYFAQTGRGWYKTISVPDWTPDGSVMVLIWTIIFILITISLLLIWNKHSGEKNFGIVISLFVLNGLLVVGWNVVFFSYQQPGIAFFEAILLIASLLLLMLLIWRFSRLAVYLLIPYSIYLLFSTALTFNVWMLN